MDIPRNPQPSANLCLCICHHTDIRITEGCDSLENRDSRLTWAKICVTTETKFVFGLYENLTADGEEDDENKKKNVRASVSHGILE